MASESPYDKLGKARDIPVPSRSVTLTGGRNETPMGVAHRGSGEWRNWRRLLDFNEVESPFDLGGGEPAGSVTGAFVPAEVEEDIFAEAGVSPVFVSASRQVQGPVYLKVTDTANGYSVQAKVPDGTYTTGVLVPPDLLAEENIPVNVLLEDGAAEFTFSQGAWLVLWLSREVMLTSAFSPARTLLIVPSV